MKKIISYVLVGVLVTAVVLPASILATRYVINNQDNSDTGGSENNQATINQLSAQITSLQTQIASMYTEDQMQVLLTQINDLEGEISGLEGKIDDMYDSDYVTPLRTQRDNLVIERDDLLDQVSNMYTSAEITALTDQLDTLQNAISDIAVGQSGNPAAQLAWIAEELKDLQDEVEKLLALMEVPYLADMPDGAWLITLDSAKSFILDIFVGAQIDAFNKLVQDMFADALTDAKDAASDPSDIVELDFAFEFLQGLFPDFAQDENGNPIILEDIYQFWAIIDKAIIIQIASNMSIDLSEHQFENAQEAKDILYDIVIEMGAYRDTLGMSVVTDGNRIRLESEWHELKYENGNLFFHVDGMDIIIRHENGVMFAEANGDMEGLDVQFTLEFHYLRNSTVSRLNPPSNLRITPDGQINLNNPNSTSFYIKGPNDTDFVYTNNSSWNISSLLQDAEPGTYQIAVRSFAWNPITFHGAGNALVLLDSELSNYVEIEVVVQEIPTDRNFRQNSSNSSILEWDNPTWWQPIHIYYRFSDNDEWINFTTQSGESFTINVGGIDESGNWQSDWWSFWCSPSGQNINFAPGTTIQFSIRDQEIQRTFDDRVLTISTFTHSNTLSVTVPL